MEYKDLNKKSAAELERMLAEERGTLYDLKLKARLNQLKDVKAMSATKKKIAKILTKLNSTTKPETPEKT